jgi:Cytochrome P450
VIIVRPKRGLQVAPLRREMISGPALLGSAVKGSARPLMPREYLMRETIQYIRHLLPLLFDSVPLAERPAVPMIDSTLSKRNALPPNLWGLLYDGWQPMPDEGSTVFLTGLADRGADNLKKRIYVSALTPDLYGPMYQEKVVTFWKRLFAPANEGKPLLRLYLDIYFDLFWDLHLGVAPDAIPLEVREIGAAFLAVLAYTNPFKFITYKNYLKVRKLRPFLKQWIGSNIDLIAVKNKPIQIKTFVYYWLENNLEGVFKRQDIVFEVFNNFLALSQWGNMLHSIIGLLAADTGRFDVKKWLDACLNEDRLGCFVMELFRFISPNPGSFSVSPMFLKSPITGSDGYVLTAHASACRDPRHWQDPDDFNPARFDKPAEVRIPTECPFEITRMRVKDGRNVEITNTPFGTVYGERDQIPMPILDYPGYAPFGFGYRRCAGELFTVEVFKDLIRTIISEKLVFRSVTAAPTKVPVGPFLVIDDRMGFFRA